MRILVVEDEPAAAAVLAKGLREHAYAVDIAADGDAARDRISGTDFDLVILDVLLPRINGLELCRQIREFGSTVPILMLTARGGLDQRVEGLDAGADDYLSKPYHFPELLARVRALLRRGPALSPAIVTVADLQLDTRARVASRGMQPLPLTAKEFALLEYLMRREGQVVSRDDIAEHVWDEGFDAASSNLIDVYIQRLRRKVDDGHDLKLIRTRRGVGYTLSAGPIDDGDV